MLVTVPCAFACACAVPALVPVLVIVLVPVHVLVMLVPIVLVPRACACIVPVHTYDITTQAQAPEEGKSSFFLCLRLCRPSSRVVFVLVFVLVPVHVLVLVPVSSQFTRTFSCACVIRNVLGIVGDTAQTRP